VALYNRELSDAANWRRSAEIDCDDDMGVGAWEEFQLRTADWLTEHPLLTALVVVSGLALAVLLSHLMPAPWWSKT
jgi:broad specificity phosphatase PhoE